MIRSGLPLWLWTLLAAIPFTVPAGVSQEAPGSAQTVVSEAAVENPPATTEEAPAPQEAQSVEQGRTPLEESFGWDRRLWRLERRRDAFRDTEYKFNLRTMYLGRNKYDGTESEALAAGGWAGLKTGYFFDHLALGTTFYTSQNLYGPDDKDGTLLLEPGQGGYSVVGELYADIRIVDDLHFNVGRKEYDTPFINRNDVRMTPNTFEAITLTGRMGLGADDTHLKYGAGYFDGIKERNSDEFVPMSEDAGASVDRGVYTVGGLYQKGKFSFGAIDYYSPDIINIGYLEAKMEVPFGETWKPRLAAQFIDQRSVGDDLLQGESFTGQQYGVKAELPVGQALFTAGYTGSFGDDNLQSPWSGYPGYTSVQVEDFNRAGEGAVLLRAGYDFTFIEGLSTYALWVNGTEPDGADQYARDEYNFNVQWAPPDGILKGLSLRLRYAIVEQDGPGDSLDDFRVICNYGFNF